MQTGEPVFLLCLAGLQWQGASPREVPRRASDSKSVVYATEWFCGCDSRPRIARGTNSDGHKITPDPPAFRSDPKFISHTISWIKVQRSSWVRWGLSWAGGGAFCRGVCRNIVLMESCRYLATHRVWPLGNATWAQKNIW